MQQGDIAALATGSAPSAGLQQEDLSSSLDHSSPAFISSHQQGEPEGPNRALLEEVRREEDGGLRSSRETSGVQSHHRVDDGRCSSGGGAVLPV